MINIPKTVARPFIGLSMIVGAFYLFTIVTRGGCDPQWKDIVNIIVGVLAANLTTVVNFYFGSSSGSEEKTQIMAESMRSNGSG